ncbi:NUDIX hydrolase [Streptococcus halotolerans]|uniref:NUDIX hydrolase n=1 Tax=Streptococcus halotolerans TaxID=1814128 RepID=UPI000789059A|nr:NUDIX domain-containing protein [Streptococcus halotolerans]
MEFWDAYDETVTKTGQILTRGQIIPEGLFHLVVECIVQSTNGSILFMKRDSDKPTYPNYYEASAGGSALKGEISLDAIKREVLEETGLALDFFDFIGQKIEPKQFSIYHHYHAIYQGELEDITLQAGETTAYKWVPLAELDIFCEKNLIIPKQKELIERFINTGKWTLEKTK